LAGFVGKNGDFPFALGEDNAAGEAGDAGTDYGCAISHVVTNEHHSTLIPENQIGVY
jgi:hypothetical protein